ncbi:MAG TPA: superoxide dismutase [Candidatus Nanoarchaeia archaeon]|nr:superoxide dismutase [Candidatus Nanoarchaeia archaeon]
MKHSLPALGYAYDALEPYIDAKTMEIHHTKHHQTYVDKLNAALEGQTRLQELKVEELIADLNAIPEAIRSAVKNHGGGHANHSLFWQLLQKGVKAEGNVVNAIVTQFGSFEGFQKQFNDAALNQFGSGWAWLVLDKGKLVVYSTANQDSPLMEGKIPLLGLDVWEHAYYLKWTSNRKGYVDGFWQVVDWKKVDEFYSVAMKK